MLVELALGAWLFSGYRLGVAWKAAALVLASLAVGMVFAGKFDVASDNYVYLFLATAGLVVSRFDRWVVGAKAPASAGGSAKRSACASRRNPISGPPSRSIRSILAPGNAFRPSETRALSACGHSRNIA